MFRLYTFVVVVVVVVVVCVCVCVLWFFCCCFFFVLCFVSLFVLSFSCKSCYFCVRFLFFVFCLFLSLPSVLFSFSNLKQKGTQRSVLTHCAF